LDHQRSLACLHLKSQQKNIEKSLPFQIEILKNLKFVGDSLYVEKVEIEILSLQIGG
jgi:hypothetical protein